MPSFPPCVVLRSNDVLFTGILRSLNAAGASSVPVVFSWPGAGPWYSEHSRWFRQPVTIANPHQFPEQAVHDMVMLGQQLTARWGERLMVIPSSDTNLMFMLDHYEHFAPYFRMMGDRQFNAPRLDVVDKAKCTELLAKGGVGVPYTWPVRSISDVEHALEHMRFPCVYKPITKDYGQTFYRLHQGKKAIQCHNAMALREALGTELAQGFELLVQEKVEFGSACDEIPLYLYADRDGRIRMASVAIKEHIDPPPYGTATVLRLSWMPELLMHAQAVVNALGWRGILMIEFIRDQRDDQWKVIEINTRPWLFIDFFRRAGLGYLTMLVEDMRDQTAAWPSLKVPLPFSHSNAPVHVDLSYACQKAFSEASPTLGGLKQWLGQIQGRLSTPFLDPDDKEPARMQTADLARQWNLSTDELWHEVEERFAGY